MQALMVAMLMADLIGRAQVAEAISHQRPAEGRFAEYALTWAAFAEETILPEEALEFLRDKLAMDDAEFFDLEQRYRGKALHIAGVQRKDLLEAVRGELTKALKGQETGEQFIGRMPEIFRDYGVTALSRSHTETVFRTNMAQSYAAGRWKMQTDPVIKNMFLWRYDAVLDDRTRPEHAAMDGVTLPPDDPFWTRWYPPNGFNCRCRVVTVPVQEATVTDKASIGSINPDPGFIGSPGDWYE